MELSLFLAKLFGLYLLVTAAVWALRGEVIAPAVEELFASRGMLFLSGVIALAVGLAIAIGHPVWEANWRGVITLFGYVSIAKGIARIGFPEFPRRATGLIRQRAAGWIWIGVMLVVGGYLSWVGFTNG